MDVQTEESKSSDDSTEVTDAFVETPANETDPAPSTESTDGDTFDMLSVVRDAAPDNEDTASPADDVDGEPTKEAGEPESKADETTEDPQSEDPENYSDVPFSKHPRFQKLIRERNQYREGAEQFDQVQTFLSENGITAEEAADQLTLLAKMKTDPHAAWEQMKPMVQKLLVEAGEILPQDLTQQVRAGKLTHQAALEMNRLRSKEASRAKADEVNRQNQERREAAQAVQTIQDTVAEWEASARKDPDFDAKSDALRGRILTIHQQEGQAKTPEQALDQVQRAWAHVNSEFAKLRPSKPSITPVTAGRSPTSSSPTGPQTMLDIVKGVQAAG